MVRIMFEVGESPGTIEPQLDPEEIKQAQDLAKDCLENDYQGC